MSDQFSRVAAQLFMDMLLGKSFICQMTDKKIWFNFLRLFCACVYLGVKTKSFADSDHLWSGLKALTAPHLPCSQLHSIQAKTE